MALDSEYLDVLGCARYGSGSVADEALVLTHRCRSQKLASFGNFGYVVTVHLLDILLKPYIGLVSESVV